ncbi:MAG: YceI family protein [Phycisphaerae bacterium]|nr:YceI family protein [Phycisphaerae bacterium]
MNARAIKALFIISLSAFLTLPVAAKPETFKVDPVHSMIFFKIQHAGVGYTYGMFFNPEGQFVVDQETPENSSVTVQVKADSVNTGNTNRDNHVKGPDFLNARQFRVISFKSTSVTKTGEKTYEAKGQLSLHGVEKDIVVALEETGRAEIRGKTAMGYEGKFRIKRSDFGMTNMLAGVGDDITFQVSLEGAIQ